MPKNSYICGLDVGTAFTRIVAGEMAPDGSLYVVGLAEGPTEGVSKGSITSIDDVVSSISAVLEKLERMLGNPVDRAVVGISSPHIATQIGRGVVAVGRADSEISEEDVDRVIESAQSVATPPNYEILHVIPRTFTVDEQSGIRDPLGMSGIRLEVEAQIVQCLVSQTKNITKAVYRAGIEIEDTALSILAAAEACLTKRQKELGVALVNVGAATTSYVIFEEGDVLAVGILPVGSSHVTSDIAIGLRTSLDAAEQIKLEYGSATPQLLDKNSVLDLSEFSVNEHERISTRHVAEIIEARMEEIFQMVDSEFAKVERSGLLPAGVVGIGGGMKLPGILELAKRQFRLPASLGVVSQIETALEKARDLQFITATGLASWGAQLKGEASSKGWLTKMPFFEKMGESAKSWLGKFKK